MTAPPAFRSSRELVERLRAREPLWAIELRPPRRTAGSGLEPWIDMYHAVRRLTRDDQLVFITDNALGQSEEESLRHLHANLGADADLSRVVPFLTTKHTLEYCTRFTERAELAGHRAAIVLGGDRHDAVPRCLPHAADLRRVLRARQPGLALGGWANPYRDPAWQVQLLKRQEAETDFFLTQVVSHHDLKPLEKLLAEAQRQVLRPAPLVGVFYYRSDSPKTLRGLSRFLPVPVEGLQAEFASGLEAPQVCARTIDALRALGVRAIYLCNLKPGEAAAQLARVKAALR